MKVLVDSSVWIDFFQQRPQLSQKLLRQLSLLIEEKNTVVIYPIEVETLSGNIIPSQENLIRSVFEILEHVDLDWNSKSTWVKIIDLAKQARKSSVRIPGLVDRMILLAAQESDLVLWTLDQALQKLAKIQKVKLYPGD